jgi:N-acetylmuramoyl-L-alanine amidase
MAQCIAKTKDGVPCQLPAREGQKYCHIHRERQLFSGIGIGALCLGLLGFVANLTGVLGYFGVNPPNLYDSNSLSISDFRVGIIPGHKGNDVGGVCDDGLTESEVNQEIANLVRENIVGEGYSAQVFSDFDQSLVDYRALAILVIHTDTCQYINEYATGFKLAPALSQKDDETRQDKNEKLISCLKENYQFVTGLNYHANPTMDMTIYHSFNEVSEITPVVLIDAGYLNLDRLLLTENTNLVAKGITEGMKCYFRSEGVSLLDAVSINIQWAEDKINAHILITNNSPIALSLMDWALLDDYGNKFPFPNIILNNRSSIRIYPKQGVNTDSDFFWDISTTEWKSGDRITLIDTKNFVRDIKRIP